MPWVIFIFILFTVDSVNAQSVDEIKGKWKTSSGNIIAIQEGFDENKTNGYLEKLSPESARLYLKGEVILNDIKSENGQFKLKFTLKSANYPVECPSRYVDAIAILSANKKILTVKRDNGQFEVILNQDNTVKECKFKEKAGRTDIALNRVIPENPEIELTKIEMEGHVDEIPEPVWIDPLLPRFYRHIEGKFMVDLDMDLVKNSNTLSVEFIKIGEGKEESLDKYLIKDFKKLKPNPVSRGRWVTIELKDKIPFDEKKEGIFFYKVSLTDGITSNPHKKTFTSPKFNYYDILDNTRERAEWLSKYLFGQPFNHVRDAFKTPTEREELAWGYFVQSRNIRALVHYRNRSEEEEARGKLYIYKVFSTGNTLRYELLHQKEVKLVAGETSKRWVGLKNLGWRDRDIERFVGVHAIVGDDPDEKKLEYLPGEEDDEKYIEDEGKTPPQDFLGKGKSLFKQLAIGTRDYKIEAATMLRYIELRQRVGYAHAYKTAIAGPWRGGTMETVKIVEELKKYKRLIDEFERLVGNINNAFDDTDLGEIHKVMAGLKKKGVHIHFGAPKSGRPPAITNRPIDQSWEVYEDKILKKPGTEAFMRGLMAAATGGLAAGDVPLLRGEDNIERELNKRRRPVVHNSNEWQTPGHYIDSFTQLSDREMQFFKDAIDGRKPLNEVKGELGEALMVREYGKQWLAKQKKAGVKEPIYIHGAYLRDYNFKGGDKGGAKVGDGVGLQIVNNGSPAANKVALRLVNEMKSGPSGIESADKQLNHHVRRFTTNGITVIDPSPGLIRKIKRLLGIDTFKMKIGKKERVVLHIPAERIVSANVEKKLVTPKDLGPSWGNSERVSLRKDQIADLAQRIMAMKGLELTPWNDHRLSQKGYWEFYNYAVANGLVPKEQQKSRAEVNRLHMNGYRFNFKTKKWEYIYTGDLRGLDPFMSKEDALKEYTYRPRSKEEIAKAKERIRNGERFVRRANYTGWISPETLINPHDPTLTAEELIRYWKVMAKNRTISEDRARELIAQGKVYDGRIQRWVKRQSEGFEQINPELERARLNYQRRTRSKAKKAAVAMAVEMINQGLLESARIRGKRLKVLLRKKEDSNHAFIIVYHGQLAPNTFAWDDKVNKWYSLTPYQQQFILNLWFEGGSGFFDTNTIPKWLQDATPDGPEYTYYG